VVIAVILVAYDTNHVIESRGTDGGGDAVVEHEIANQG
jgi:hypothetical protein